MAEPQTGERPSVSFVHDDDVDAIEVKSQLRDGQRRSVWLKFLELTPEAAVFHTRYDPGLVLERHGLRRREPAPECRRCLLNDAGLVKVPTTSVV